MTVSQNKKIIFGLKVKEYRKQQGLSFQELSKRSGLSISYLNEIEKGKKYPRYNKIEALAAALGLETEELTSAQLQRSLEPVSQLINSDFLNELPLDLFGIEKAKLVSIIANSPAKVGAFIAALLEISRKYYVQQEHFYLAALRSYQELHDNYFEELEEKATMFIRKQDIPTNINVPIEQLYYILQKEYRYKINSRELSDYASLRHLESVFLPNKKRLLLNRQVTDIQKKKIAAREIGYNYLKIKERIYTSSFLKIRSFEEVLNHFKANYFAGALLIHKDALRKELYTLFKTSKWKPEILQSIINRFRVSPEMLMERLTNILPKYFGLNRLFLFSFENNNNDEKYHITKELYLTRKDQPHANEIEEHYCRRWISIWLIKKLQENYLQEFDNLPTIGIQRSRYHDSGQEYLCITVAYIENATFNKSVTLGLLIDDKLKKTINFWEDFEIPTKEVNLTCERCSIMDCKERVAPPTIIEEKKLRNKIQEELKELLGQ